MFTNIKSLFMVLMLAATAQYATAESFNQEDMAFAFGDSAVATSDFGQMDLLSSQEMTETEGEWLNFAIGGFLGFGSYLYTTPRSQWSFRGAAINTGLGLVGGYGAGVAGLRVLGRYPSTGGFGIAAGKPGLWKPSSWYGNRNQFGRIDFHRNSHDKYVHFHRGGWLR